ncbi:MAG: alpha/beta hydrolase, partial [Anaerolineae bacterium]
MPSWQSIEIKKTIEKDKLDESVPLSVKRQEWEDYARSLPLPESVTQEAEKIGDVPCLWVKADNAFDEYVIVYLHGGGLVEGSAITTREFGARLTMMTRIPVLIVDYRLAPEHPYPAALEDAQSVYNSLLNGRYQPDQMIFGGDSNGGGLVLSTLLALRDSATKLPRCGFLISP